MCLNQNVNIMKEQINNLNKEIKTIKKNEIETLELKYAT